MTTRGSVLLLLATTAARPQDDARAVPCHCFSTCNLLDAAAFVAAIPRSVDSRSSPWYAYLAAVYGEAEVPLPFALSRLNFFYHNDLRWRRRFPTVEWPMASCLFERPDQQSRIMSNAYRSDVPRDVRNVSSTACAATACERWLAPSSQRVRVVHDAKEARVRVGDMRFGRILIANDEPANVHGAPYRVSTRGAVLFGASDAWLSSARRTVSAPADQPLQPTATQLGLEHSPDGSWIEVMRSGKEGEGHGGAGCWFFPAAGSGVWLDAGVSASVRSRRSLSSFNPIALRWLRLHKDELPTGAALTSIYDVTRSTNTSRYTMPHWLEASAPSWYGGGHGRERFTLMAYETGFETVQLTDQRKLFAEVVSTDGVCIEPREPSWPASGGCVPLKLRRGVMRGAAQSPTRPCECDPFDSVLNCDAGPRDASPRDATSPRDAGGSDEGGVRPAARVANEQDDQLALASLERAMELLLPHAARLATEPATRALLIGASAEQVALWSRRLPRSQLHVVPSAASLTSDRTPNRKLAGRLDLVVDCGADPSAAVVAAFDALRPGGLYIVSDLWRGVGSEAGHGVRLQQLWRQHPLLRATLKPQTTAELGALEATVPSAADSWTARWFGRRRGARDQDHQARVLATTMAQHPWQLLSAGAARRRDGALPARLVIMRREAPLPTADDLELLRRRGNLSDVTMVRCQLLTNLGRLFAFSSHGTDKCTRHYDAGYTMLLPHYRHTAQRVLEIGIGSPHAPSLRAWLGYYPKAMVYGHDKRMLQIDPDLLAHKRVGVHTGVRVPQSAREMTKSFAGLQRLDDSWAAEHVPADLDVMVDDGCHLPFCQVRTLELYWPRIKVGGLYVIEDLFIAGSRRGLLRSDLQEQHPLLNQTALEALSPTAARIFARNPWAWFIGGLDGGRKFLADGLTREDIQSDASKLGLMAMVAIRKVYP